MAQTLLLVLVAITGWLLGALVNYLADVLPLKRRLAPPLCQYCQASIPLASYFWWPRRCPQCTKHRSLRTWIVELVMVGLALWLWVARPDPRLAFPVALALTIYFLLVIIIDLEHYLILDMVNLFGALLAFGIGWALHGLVPTLLGGLAGAGTFLALSLFGYLLMRFIPRYKKENLEFDDALGMGDIKLAGVLGLLLGWPGITLGLLTTILLAGVGNLIAMVVLVIARRYSADKALPFGPFLALAGFALIFLRHFIIQ